MITENNFRKRNKSVTVILQCIYCGCAIMMTRMDADLTQSMRRSLCSYVESVVSRNLDFLRGGRSSAPSWYFKWLDESSKQTSTF